MSFSYDIVCMLVEDLTPSEQALANAIIRVDHGWMLRQPEMALKYVVPLQILSYKLLHVDFNYSDELIDEILSRARQMDFISAVYYTRTFRESTDFRVNKDLIIPTDAEQLKQMLLGKATLTQSDSVDTQDVAIQDLVPVTTVGSDQVKEVSDKKLRNTNRRTGSACTQRRRQAWTMRMNQRQYVAARKAVADRMAKLGVSLDVEYCRPAVAKGCSSGHNDPTYNVTITEEVQPCKVQKDDPLTWITPLWHQNPRAQADEVQVAIDCQCEDEDLLPRYGLLKLKPASGKTFRQQFSTVILTHLSIEEIRNAHIVSDEFLHHTCDIVWPRIKPPIIFTTCPMDAYMGTNVYYLTNYSHDPECYIVSHCGTPQPLYKYFNLV